MNNPHISPVNKLTYGIGSIAYGVKSNGFDYWFLIFYSQAMGVDAYLVGLALMISLPVEGASSSPCPAPSRQPAQPINSPVLKMLTKTLPRLGSTKFSLFPSTTAS